jgi:hypothetical protein
VQHATTQLGGNALLNKSKAMLASGTVTLGASKGELGPLQEPSTFVPDDMKVAVGDFDGKWSGTYTYTISRGVPGTGYRVL